MKKIILTGVALLLLTAASFACDICGCSVSNYNPFLFPHLSKSFVGFTYLHRAYEVKGEAEAASKQRYSSLLLTAQYSPVKKLQLVAMVPYQFNQLELASEKNKVNGLSDITLLTNYKLWEKMTKVYRQTVLAGVGVKLATGKYSPPKTETINDQSFQLGTGSTDYLLNASYRLSYRTWVFSIAGSYKYNTENKDNFRFGDILTTGATAAYRIDLDKTSIMPYLQVTHESQMKDADHHILQKHSGGIVLYSGAGVDINTKKTTVGINYQLAPEQHLAGGEILVKPRISTHVSFAF